MVTVEIPGVFVGFVIACYMDFDKISDMYAYKNIVNGIETCKVQIYAGKMPNFITVTNHPNKHNKQLLTISNYKAVPPNFTILIKSKNNDQYKQAIEHIT